MKKGGGATTSAVRNAAYYKQLWRLRGFLVAIILPKFTNILVNNKQRKAFVLTENYPRLRKRPKPSKPSRPLPNSQTAAGIGTGEVNGVTSLENVS